MSEQNILNPTAQSVTNPDYGIKLQDASVFARWQSRSGRPFARRLSSRGQVIQLQWNNRLFSTYDTLRQWARQYENDFFSYFDIDDNRYYSGQFSDMPTYEITGNQRVNIAANFVVVPNLPQFAYPSNWGVDSVFFEERDGFGQDLVKLTGTWDHGDNNYAIFSEQFDDAAWSKTNATVTANAVNDPNGNPTAESVAYSVTGTGALVGLAIAPKIPVAGQQFTFSCWLKAASGTPTINLLIEDQANAVCGGPTQFTMSTSWQRFSITGTMLTTSTSVKLFIYNPNQTPIAYHFWGAQFEYGNAPTTYVTSAAAPAVLPAPNRKPNFHSGFVYSNGGTVTTDAAEWKYFGYGFRVWAPKGPDQGIMEVFLDGVSQGTVDLYNAAIQASAALLTVQSVALGDHRVKLAPTNTKNASSSGFIVTADAIEVMR